MPSPSLPPPPALAARLEPGERLLWWGRPHPGLALQRRDVLLVPLSVVWLWLAIQWQVEAMAADARAGSLLFGAGFIAIGLYMLAGRFPVEAWQRRRTIYGVTSRRALVLAPLGNHALKLGELGRCRIEGEPGGRRMLAFGRDPLKQFQFNWSRGFTSRRPAGFVLVDDAEGALAAIRAAQEGRAAA